MKWGELITALIRPALRRPGKRVRAVRRPAPRPTGAAPFKRPTPTSARPTSGRATPRPSARATPRATARATARVRGNLAKRGRRYGKLTVIGNAGGNLANGKNNFSSLNTSMGIEGEKYTLDYCIKVFSNWPTEVVLINSFVHGNHGEDIDHVIIAGNVVIFFNSKCYGSGEYTLANPNLIIHNTGKKLLKRHLTMDYTSTKYAKILKPYGAVIPITAVGVWKSKNASAYRPFIVHNGRKGNVFLGDGVSMVNYIASNLPRVDANIDIVHALLSN